MRREAVDVRQARAALHALHLVALAQRKFGPWASSCSAMPLTSAFALLAEYGNPFPWLRLWRALMVTMAEWIAD